MRTARGEDKCSTHYNGFHNAADTKPDDGGRRGGGRARTRRRTAVLGRGVDNHDVVGCDFWAVPLDPVFIRLVEVVLRRFFDNDRLGKRRRLQLRMRRRRVDEGFRRRTLNCEELCQRLQARRSGEGTQMKNAHVEIENKFG